MKTNRYAENSYGQFEKLIIATKQRFQNVFMKRDFEAINREFVLIEKGEFRMGAKNQEDSLEHKVHVSAFIIQAHETTTAQWNSVWGWAVKNRYSFDNKGLGKGLNHPITNVNWFDAIKWCNARSEMENLEPVYYTDKNLRTVFRNGHCDMSNENVLWTGNGFRLPTEAEWEKAARGGLDQKKFPCGDDISYADANYCCTYKKSFHPLGQLYGGIFGGTTPVGSFSPNAYGIYDMAGNVAEWCWDWYSIDFYNSGPVIDPRGPSKEQNQRVVRGGSWYPLASDSECQVAWRDRGYATFAREHLGFRVVRTVLKPEANAKN